MVKVYEINGVTPVVHPSAYVHPSAVLIGDVIIGPRCYIGPLASIRGDFGRLILEEGANLQDTCVMHGFPGCDTVVEVDLFRMRVIDDAVVQGAVQGHGGAFAQPAAGDQALQGGYLSHFFLHN